MHEARKRQGERVAQPRRHSFARHKQPPRVRARGCDGDESHVLNEEKGTGAVRQDRRPMKALPAPVQVLRRGHWRRRTTFEPSKGYPTRRRIGRCTAAPGSRTAAGGPLPRGKEGASFGGLPNRDGRPFDIFGPDRIGRPIVGKPLEGTLESPCVQVGLSGRDQIQR